MNDTTTQEPLRVATDGGAGPYVTLPLVRLAKVEALLKANHLPFWVDEETISLDGKPEIAIINFREGTNPRTIQRLLDNIS